MNVCEAIMIYYETELYHHGIRGQKWGEKNGPPYPLSGRQYSYAEERYRKRTRKAYSQSNKKHYDKTLSSGTTLRTLSYDKNRTKNTDMFYATHTTSDKHLYNALFNKPINSLEGKTYKYKIDNSVKRDLKVASEDSGAKVFADLYSKNRDFSNFVLDENRMQSYFVQDKYKFKGYREARDTLAKMRDSSYTPTSTDLKTVYRMFNYTIPYDGNGNKSNGKDVLQQRTKFFNELSKQGYGAVLDTNDAIYGGFKADSPIIVFDMKQVIPKQIKETKLSDKRISELVMIAEKILP